MYHERNKRHFVRQPLKKDVVTVAGVEVTVALTADAGVDVVTVAMTSGVVVGVAPTAADGVVVVMWP